MQREPSRRKSAVVILLFLAVLAGGVYVLHKPTLQVYWAIYARIYPGKDAPGGLNLPADDSFSLRRRPGAPDADALTAQAAVAKDQATSGPAIGLLTKHRSLISRDRVEKEQQRAKAAALPAIKAKADQLQDRPDSKDERFLNTNAKMAAAGDADAPVKLEPVTTMANGSSTKQNVVLTAAKPAGHDVDTSKAGAAAADSVMEEEVQQVTGARLDADVAAGASEDSRQGHGNTWHPKKGSRKRKSMAAHKGQAARDAMLSSLPADRTGAASDTSRQQGVAADKRTQPRQGQRKQGTQRGRQDTPHLVLPSGKTSDSRDPTSQNALNMLDNIGNPSKDTGKSGSQAGSQPGAQTGSTTAKDSSKPSSQGGANPAVDGSKPVTNMIPQQTQPSGQASDGKPGAAAQAAGRQTAAQAQGAVPSKPSEGGGNSPVSNDVAGMAAVLRAHDVDLQEGPSGKVAADAASAHPSTAGNAAAAGQPGVSKAVAGWTGNAADYKLTPELVRQYASGKVIMVTWANYHYRDFVLNWVEHVRACKVDAYLVGAMDDQLLELLAKQGIRTFGMQSGLSLDDFGWGSKTFHKMGREKINLIATFTRMGFDILVSDVDTVWLQDPLPYMARFPDAAVLTSSDNLANTVEDDSLERFPQAGSPANIGIMLFRTTAAALANEWIQVLKANDEVWDQNAFNDLFRRGVSVEPERKDGLFKGYDGKLLIGILPVSIFCSGHTYFVQRLHKRLGLTPYVVHATFQYSGTPGKRHRMRERLLWHDPPAYFDPPGGLLTFDMDLTGLLDGAAPAPRDGSLERTTGHFRLVHHQLVQVRNAMAIAQTLGRVLVIPELWCGQDRWWAPHDGLIPGAQGPSLPFQCPLDHVLDLEQMSKELPEDEFGPNLRFREYSLLNNSRFPANSRPSKLVVNICTAGDSMCSDGTAPAAEAAPGVVNMARLLQDVAISQALQAYKDVKILHFSTMYNAFAGFAAGPTSTMFEKRTQTYTSIWCCVNAHPGHVWYDMWWDVVPHVDRHSRSIQNPWQPVTGP